MVTGLDRQILLVLLEQGEGLLHTPGKVDAAILNGVKGVVERREAHGVGAQADVHHLGDVAVVGLGEVSAHGL